MPNPPRRSRLISLRARLCSLLDPLQLKSLPQWRARLASYLIAGLLVCVPVCLVSAAPALRKGGHWELVAVEMAAWLWALVATLRPQGRWRSHACLFAIYAIYITGMVSMGPEGARPAWMVAVPVSCALLFGARAALLSVAGNVVLVLGLRLLLGPSHPAWAEAYAHDADWWRMYLTAVTLLSTVTALPFGFLLDGLAAALSKERKLRHLLAEEHQGLERAHTALLDEVAERERLQHHLRQAQKLEALGNLAGGVAHDLNNFLLPITLCTEMVQERLAVGSRDHTDLARVLDASERAKELIARVLAFSRKVPPPDAYVDLGDLLTELVEQMRPSFPPGLRVDVARSGPCDPVFSNRAALGQVVTNLVSNAVAAMPEGGLLGLTVAPLERAAGLAECAQDEVSGEVELIVSDTGAGMDADTAERAFEPFFTTKGVGQGTGLGLATVHGIVASLGGKVAVDTAPGHGSSFRITLPTRRAPNVQRISGVHPRLSEFFRGRVLLVDDDDDGRAALHCKLEQMGLEVITEPDVRSALDRLASASAPFDLLITDHQMPGEDGLEFIRRVRASRTRMPIVLVTGFPDRALTERARALQVDVLLPKPFGHREIVCALGATLPRATDSHATA